MMQKIKATVDPLVQYFHLKNDTWLHDTDLSKILTTILSTVQNDLQTYCDEIYSTCCLNQMWILKKKTKKLKIYC